MERAARPASLILGAASLLAVIWAVVARSVVGGAIAVALGTLAIAAAVMAERTVRAVFKGQPPVAPAPRANSVSVIGPSETPYQPTVVVETAESPAAEPETVAAPAQPATAAAQPAAWSASTVSGASAVSVTAAETPEPAPEEETEVALEPAATVEPAVEIESAAEAPEVQPALEPSTEHAPIAVPASTAGVHALPAAAESAPGEALASRIGITFPAAPDADSVVLALLATMGTAVDARSTHLWLRDDDSETLRLLAVAGPEPARDTPVPLSDATLGVAAKTGEWASGRIVRTADEADTRWRVAVPVSSGDLHGVAAVDVASAEEPDTDIVLAHFAPLQASLTGALVLHVARQEAHTAETLLAVAKDLGRLLDPSEVVSVALEHAMRLSGAQTGSVLLLESDGALRIAVARGLPDDVVQTTRVGEGDGIAGWVLASGQPLVVEDMTGSPRSRRHGVRSAVSVPIADDEGILGVMNVGSRRYHARFSKAHLEGLEAVGRITALSLRNARAARQSSELYFDTLKTLALALETKDPYAQGGTERILEIVEVLGAELGVEGDDMRALRIAAMLHDIGMTAAGDVVAVGDRPLSTVEWGLLKMHPSIAADIIGQAPALKAVAPIVYHHHEHYDGSGYVAGVAGSAIPLGARILAVADAYVAMTSDRPYRAAMTPDRATAELVDKSGSQFDPRVVSAFVEMSRRQEADEAARDREASE
jgi:response regulator RpfG family c-di-GMP phosphodiesterase